MEQIPDSVRKAIDARTEAILNCADASGLGNLLEFS
jgi:hypothetical protein